MQGGEILDILCRLNDQARLIVMVTTTSMSDPTLEAHRRRDGEIAADEPVSERFTPLSSWFLQTRSAQ